MVGQLAAVHQHHPQLGFMLPEIVAPKIAVLAIEYILLRFLVKYQIGDVVVSDLDVSQFHIHVLLLSHIAVNVKQRQGWVLRLFLAPALAYP
jgi:hypothetical protein